MNYIPVFLLALVVLCLCACLGNGVLALAHLTGSFAANKRGRAAPGHGRVKGQPLGGADALLTGELILIGLASTAHVTAVFTGQSFSRCSLLFLIALGTFLLLAAALLLFCAIFHMKALKEKGLPVEGGTEKLCSTEKILTGLFLAVVASQLLFLLWNAGVYRLGDMTVETVGSFLHTDGIYQVDPMTGQAYTAGIPTRLKILCLPTLYGSLCRLSGLEPERLVTAAVPVWILASSYAAFSCVGRSLFPKSGVKRACFLVTVAVLIWTGIYFHSMDGFGLLYCGYRGVVIRNLVLMPYLISLCLRRKWLPSALCLLAEACIVWTFYGLGACLLTAVGLFLAGRRKYGGTS